MKKGGTVALTLAGALMLLALAIVVRTSVALRDALGEGPLVLAERELVTRNDGILAAAGHMTSSIGSPEVNPFWLLRMPKA